jgi:hypothetical protein
VRGDGRVDERRCEAVALALSAELDRIPLPEGAAAHAAGCPRCSSFRTGAWRVRELTRLDLAPNVPDLVPAIMERVGAERRPRRRRGNVVPIRPVAPPARPLHRTWLRPAAAAAAVGLVAGFVLTAGVLGPDRGTPPAALAATIPRDLRRAAATLHGYTATFDLTELHWTRAVSGRTFVMDVAFRAPEDFSVRVRDTTAYPSSAWPRNDLTLVTDGTAWRAAGPDPCPPAALPNCPSKGPTVREVVGRPPFDADTPAPTDLIVPTTVLAAQDRVDPVAADAVAGRPAVAVDLTYAEATPLFRAFTFAGSWRPYFPQDKVIVWLDRRTWFPLRYDVYPAPGAERALWAAQQGLPHEPPGTPVFSAVARSFSTRPPNASTFAVPTRHSVVTDRFRAAPLTRTESWPTPSFTAGLRPVRAGTSPGPGDAHASTVAYASGLSWLTVTHVTGWRERRPFGVGQFASPVTLGPDGRALYEPASADSPRRVAIHSANGEFLVDSNLTPAQLLRVAASLPVDGVALPSSWLVRTAPNGTVVRLGLTAGQALAAAGFAALVPRYLPDGDAAAAAELARGPRMRAITILYRSPTAQLDGDGIAVYQATGQRLAPPTDPGALAVLVRGVVGRWSPDEATLEWIQGHLYVSITAPGEDLSVVVRIADSLRPARRATPGS